jgi:hypothetical protein
MQDRERSHTETLKCVLAEIEVSRSLLERQRGSKTLIYRTNVFVRYAEHGVAFTLSKSTIGNCS